MNQSTKSKSSPRAKRAPAPKPLPKPAPWPVESGKLGQYSEKAVAIYRMVYTAMHKMHDLINSLPDACIDGVLEGQVTVSMELAASRVHELMSNLFLFMDTPPGGWVEDASPDAPVPVAPTPRERVQAAFDDLLARESSVRWLATTLEEFGEMLPGWFKLHAISTAWNESNSETKRMFLLMASEVPWQEYLERQ